MRVTTINRPQGTGQESFVRTAPLARQCQKVLDALRAAGPAGLTNLQLVSIALRYSSRVAELRARGYRIRTIRVNESLYCYVLEFEPSEETPVPTFTPKPKGAVELPLFAEVGHEN